MVEEEELKGNAKRGRVKREVSSGTKGEGPFRGDLEAFVGGIYRLEPVLGVGVVAFVGVPLQRQRLVRRPGLLLGAAAAEKRGCFKSKECGEWEGS